jgi:hypothetical protein
LPGDAPEIVDYRKTDNPYAARCPDDWKKKVRQRSQMSFYVCITDLVEHIVKVSREHFVNTPYKDNWMFYHDALSLMTAKDTVKWMIEMDYYK